MWGHSRQLVTFSATKACRELSFYCSKFCFTVKDDFQTPFLTLKKVRPFIMMLIGLQVFPSVSLFRVIQESRAMCSVLVLTSTNENKLSLYVEN